MISFSTIAFFISSLYIFGVGVYWLHKIFNMAHTNDYQQTMDELDEILRNNFIVRKQ